MRANARDESVIKKLAFKRATGATFVGGSLKVVPAVVELKTVKALDLAGSNSLRQSKLDVKRLLVPKVV